AGDRAVLDAVADLGVELLQRLGVAAGAAQARRGAARGHPVAVSVTHDAHAKRLARLHVGYGHKTVGGPVRLHDPSVRLSGSDRQLKGLGRATLLAAVPG